VQLRTFLQRARDVVRSIVFRRRHRLNQRQKCTKSIEVISELGDFKPFVIQLCCVIAEANKSEPNLGVSEPSPQRSSQRVDSRRNNRDPLPHRRSAPHDKNKIHRMASHQTDCSCGNHTRERVLNATMFGE
jgi:hypothetical protein